MDDATYDWRTILQPDYRQGIVNQIIETLKRHVLVSGPEGLVELGKNATRLEENIYMASTSQLDYLQKLSMKMLTIETIPQTTGMSNTIQSNFAASAPNPPASASDGMAPQMHNQWLSQIPLPNQPQAPQQLFSQNLQNTIVNVGIHSSYKLPPVTSLTHTSVLNAAGQSTNMQSRVEQNSVGSSVSQGLPPNTFFNTLLYQQQQQHFSSIDSTAQTGHNAVDWQEECYQKIKSMKELYLPDLNDMYQKISIKCQQSEDSGQVVRLEMFKNILERDIRFLNGSKNNIVPALKEKLPFYERRIIDILNSRKPFSAQQQIQQPGGGSPPLSILQQQQYRGIRRSSLSLPKTITPTNVVSVASSLSTPLLEKDLEKQSLVTTTATP